MAHINLLPWREELRQVVTLTVLSLALTGALIFMVHVIFNGQIEHQKFRNKMLQDEITTLDAALKQIATLEETKEKLLARMDVIQSLHCARRHLFNPD
jgi:type IV pilus assembly protein PilN